MDQNFTHGRFCCFVSCYKSSKSFTFMTGVHGKLAELGEVTHDSYKLALTVIMTNDIDSIVVDNEETAKECVTYLKKQQIAPMTFLPLQTIKVRQPSERLRQIGGTAKLAIDLVSFKPQLEKAFMSACGQVFIFSWTPYTTTWQKMRGFTS